MENRKNWAENYTYKAQRFHTPQTIEEIQSLAKQSTKLKVLGSRHSFNEIADTTEDMISLEKMNNIISFDEKKEEVEVEGGIKYSELCHYLHEKKYALKNMASLPHISVAGACATATHGSGDENQSLSASVTAIELVTADGEIKTFSKEKNKEEFEGIVVGLGAIGIVTKLTLAVVPEYSMRQDVFLNLPLSTLQDSFDEITASAYSVSLFTDWKEERFNQVWLKRIIKEGKPLAYDAAEFFGAEKATEKLNPVPGASPKNCTEQLGSTGYWSERLAHFKIEFTPSSGKELQTEYILPRQYAYVALKALAEIKEQIAPLLQISEVRTIAADTLWMSPAYYQESIGIHFTWVDDIEGVRAILPIIEKQLAPFFPRPHWGKVFTMKPAELQARFEKLDDFKSLTEKYDPTGKFRNSFLNTYLFSGDVAL